MNTKKKKKSKRNYSDARPLRETLNSSGRVFWGLRFSNSYRLTPDFTDKLENVLGINNGKGVAAWSVRPVVPSYEIYMRVMNMMVIVVEIIFCSSCIENYEGIIRTYKLL